MQVQRTWWVLLIALLLMGLPGQALHVAEGQGPPQGGRGGGGSTCPHHKPVILSVVSANYYPSATWPATVVAEGPNPFSLQLFPEFYSSYQPEVELDSGAQFWDFSQYVAGNGCYRGSWSSNQDIPDGPFTPVWCVDDPSIPPQYCAAHGRPAGGVNEHAIVEVYDTLGLEAVAVTNPAQVIRNRGGIVFYP